LDQDLDRIASGEATPAEARRIVAAILDDGSERSLARLYAAFGSWLWRALEGRRRDAELREWFDIVRRIEVQPKVAGTPYAERFRALRDLIHTSVNVSEILQPAEILRRLHARTVLEMLQEAAPRPVAKSVIARRLKLLPANLTRIVNMLAGARLLERTVYGKQARFAITREGIAAMADFDLAARRAAERLGSPKLTRKGKAFVEARRPQGADGR
jgi:predicted transcriptional regulator